MPATTRPLFEQIDSWLQEIDNTKTAAAAPAPSKPKKTAGVKKAAPAGMGETTHPSEDVDNNTQDEETGARFEENSADVKKDVPGMAVDETDAGGGGDQDSKQYNIGTEQSATGEDPSVEDDYKGDKDDPGTSHPMNADDTGEKYSSMQLGKLLKAAEDKAHAILADLANGVGQPQPTAGTSVSQKAAAIKPAVVATPKPEVKPDAAKTAAAAGYDAASQTQAAPDMEKVAAEFVAQTIRDADLDADLVGSFVLSYKEARDKKAADEASEGEDHKEPDGDEGGAPPADPSGAGGGSPDAGAPPGGGGDVLGALGAAAADAPPMGGDLGGAGGPPPDAGGGMSQEQALQELAMALQELGISPEELAQLAQAGGGAGGPPPDAGAPPMGGPPVGGPPVGGGDMGGGPPPELAAEGAKLASAARGFMRGGKFRVEEAKTAAQRQVRDQIKDYIREITGFKG